MTEPARCEEHVGDAFPTRCSDCDAAEAQEAAQRRIWNLTSGSPTPKPDDTTTTALAVGGNR